MPNWRPLMLVLTSLAVAGCGNSGTKSDPSASPSAQATGESNARLTKLVKEDLKQGKGPIEAKAGDQVWAWYSGSLANGTVFDSHLMPDPPMPFTLNDLGLIKGWIQGIPGMRAGGKRRLSVPAELGYGAMGQGAKIPPDSDLFFDITLAYVVQPGKEKVFDLIETKVGSGAEAKQGSKVSILYVGTLLNAQKVIEKSDAAHPEVFTIGNGEVIQGLEYGIKGMKKGGKRTLILPPAAAFGDRGSPPSIPANSPMRFDVELLDVK